MRQASGDLFPTDAPIPASQMIGRADDVREIATALENGTNLIVAAPRRTGKTSVCDAALGRLSRRGYYTVHLDLFRIADAAELAEMHKATTAPGADGKRAGFYGHDPQFRIARRLPAAGSRSAGCPLAQVSHAM